MFLIKDQRGLTFIETTVAIAIMMVLLPVVVLTFTRLAKETSYFNVSQRLDQAAAITYSELSNEFTNAQSFSVSGSTWGLNPSTFSFVDGQGETVTIDVVDDTVSLPGGEQTISRLRWRRSGETAWFTDSDIDVTNWTARVVRDSTADLTGLSIEATFSMANKTDVPFKNAETSLVMNFVLPITVVEL